MEMESNPSEEGLGAVRDCVERLQAQLQRVPGSNQACLDILRALTSKLLTTLTTQEKARKHLASRAVGGLPLLVSILEHTQDQQVVHNIILVLKELISSKSVREERARILVSHGITHHLLRILSCCRNTGNYGDDFVSSLYTVLAKLGYKDKKFAVKARLLGILPVTLAHIKYYSHKPKVLPSVLMVLRGLLTSSVNAVCLGKEGLIPLLLSLLGITRQKLTVAAASILEALAVATRSKFLVRQVVKHDGLPTLQQLLDPQQWSGTGRKGARLTRIFRATLQVFVHISFTKNGREALSDAAVIPFLLCWCQSLPGGNEKWDRLATLVSLIIQRCLPPLPMPIASFSSFLNFPLPEQLPTTIDTGNEDEKDLAACENDSQSSSSSEESSDSDVESEPVNERIGQQFCEEEILHYRRFFSELEREESLLISNNLIGTSNLKCKPDVSLSFLNLEQAENDDEVSSLKEEFKELTLVKYSLSFNQDTDRNYDKISCPKSFQNTRNKQLVESSSQESVSSTEAVTESFPSNSLQIVDHPDHIQQSFHLLATANSHTDKEERDVCLPEKNEKYNKDNFTSLELKNLLESAKAVQRVEKFLEGVNVYEVYKKMASKTKGIASFTKIAHPDLKNAGSCNKLEPLFVPSEGLFRTTILKHAELRMNKEDMKARVVYDYDKLVTKGENFDSTKCLANDDEKRIKKCNKTCHLEFESRFESGNLRKAIQVGEREYTLILNPDINSCVHHQWFYFEVYGMEAEVSYKFNIINLEKSNSLFNQGMLPLLYSVTEFTTTGCGWIRTGKDVCYYRNHYIRGSSLSSILHDKPYYTLTFTIIFPHPNDVCYLAYHYPYTYSTLMNHLYCWENSYDTSSVYFRRDELCQTLGGNSLPLLTITAQPPDTSRPYVFLTARVHPGESNSSWAMKGTMDFLVSNKPSAQRLRETFIFKVVPMLNPDGVINGCHRCSLTGQDLNRQWIIPSSKLHPSIYHTKALLHYLYSSGKRPLVFCDYHGHSRRKNVFLYGCSPSLSWWPGDANKPDDQSYEVLALLMHHVAPAFSLENCCFIVERSREATARIAVWRQFGVTLSYTMECSYGGCDQGLYAGYHIGTAQLEETGMKLCQALGKLMPGLGKPGDIQTLMAIDPSLMPGIRSAQTILFPSTEQPAPVSSSQSEEDVADGTEEN